MTTDTILSTALTFVLLIGGTAAIGSELVGTRHPTAATTHGVMLPAVTVIGLRQNVVTVAAAAVAVQPQRVQ